MQTDPDHEPFALDDLLDASAPSGVELAPDVGERFARMIDDAGREAPSSRPLRRFPRAAIAGIAVVIALGGGTAAAAMTINEWAPWAETADGSFEFVLPSGAVCEARVGGFDGRDGEVDEVIVAAREYLRSVDILAVADVEGALAELSTTDTNESRQQENENEFQPSPDSQYQFAVSTAVSEALNAELVRQGFDLAAANFSSQMETHCPDAQW